MKRRGLLLGAVVSAALLQACATPRVMSPDATLFPRTPPIAPVPGRVAVQMRPEWRDLVHLGEQGPARSMHIPIGRIVEQAVVNAAAQAFTGGAAAPPADEAATRGLTGTLVIQGVRLAYDTKLIWFLPLPYVFPSDHEYDLRLALDISALDGRGQVLWTRIYDDGRQLWQHSWDEQGKAAEGLFRLTHEAAWRLAQRAVRDLRDWAEAERLRERSL